MVKIAVGSLARNCEKSLPRYSSWLQSLKSVIEFDSFIYENDSTDSTKEIISKISDHYICENLSLKSFENSPAIKERTDIIAQCRNKLKDLIFQTDNYNIVIFTDSDLISWPDPTIIKQNIDKINSNNRIGAITSNGLSLYHSTIIYYDIFALVIDNKIQNHKIWTDFDIQNMEVDSAFGGLGIFRGEAIRYIKYHSLELEGFPCPWHPVIRTASENCSLNLQIREQNLKILIDKSQILYR